MLLRLGLLLTTMSLMAAAALYATSAAPSSLAAQGEYWFSDAEREIVCGADGPADARPPKAGGGFVECDDLATFGGPQDYPKSGIVYVRGGSFIYRSDNADDPIDSRKHPVPAGHVWHVGYIRCVSGRRTMKCSSLLTGHGFYLSRGSQRRW